MNIDDLAKRIPAEVRNQRLLTEADPIETASVSASDPKMILLAEVWYTYIEPFKDRSYCPVCLSNILKTMQGMRTSLIELEDTHQRLNLL